MASSSVALLLVLILLVHGSAAKQPNIILILTDDQDTAIGGEIPMMKTQELIGQQGIVFKNAFVSTPLCCPSRSSILTGKYTHNHLALNNSLSGGCSSATWQLEQEPHTVAVQLKSRGYRTYFAGKYLNQYGYQSVGGLEHIPPGWDEWYALWGNSRYYNYTVSDNGVTVKHKDSYTEDYFTDNVHKRAIQYLDQIQTTSNSHPFFMMVAPPAPHAPFNSAPQYSQNYSDVTPDTRGSFNTAQNDKHWLMRQVIQPMTDQSIAYINKTYINRWRTLLSVDDMIEDIVETLERRGLLETTYVFYTSDNGYHLGQFSLPRGKMQMYEFDIRVPFMVRGPGIQTGQVRQEIIVNIDLAPTFLDLAGGHAPSSMDGQSFKKLLQTDKAVPWQQDFLVEHQGQYVQSINHCPQWNYQNVGNCFPSCVCEDAKNNTYSCVRAISETDNHVYCEFKDDEDFVEAYNLLQDPDQMTNIADSLTPDQLTRFKDRLHKLAKCHGHTCRQL